MRASLIASATCLSIVGLAIAADVQAAMRRPTSIEPQGLGAALQELAREHDFQIVYRPEFVRDRQSAGASGDFTPSEALTQILTGTGLTYRYLDTKTVTIVPITAVAPRATESQTETSAPDIEEVVVTAQKRKERLLDTPQSVSVLSADSLARLGATQFRDFANTVPGLNFTTSGPGFSQVSMRGVTMGYDAGSTIGMYIDEVPFGATGPFVQAAQSALDMGLSDVERIEVLRGPQGTLYGASAMGGLIKYVTKLPSTTEFRGEAQGGLSSTERGGINYDAAAAVNIPLADGKAALRASAFETHDDGFIDNLALGRKDVNRSDIYGGRLDLLLTPTDASTLRLTGFAQNISRDGEGTANYSFSGTPLFGSLDQSRVLEEPFDQRVRLLSGTLTYAADWGTVTSVSSYQATRIGYVADISANYVPLFAGFFGRTFGSIGYPVDLDVKKFAQEVRLASQDGRPLEWQVGGFYTHERTENLQQFLFNDTNGVPVPSATDDYFYYDNPSKFEEYAAFGDLTWHLTDRLEATAGLRYAESRQQTEQEGRGAFVSNQPAVESTDSATTYLALARYHFNQHATGYVRFATGYRPGGPNLAVVDATTGLPIGQPAFEPDRLESYEAGFKAETEDRRWSVDLSVYHIDWNNIQIAVLRGGFGAIANTPSGASVDGAEMTFTALPAKGLQLSTSLAYQAAQLDAADADVGAASGERLPNVPRFTGALNADYEWGAGWRPSLGATLRHVGARPIAFNGSANQYQLPSYTSTDLRAGLAIGRSDLQLYVHNVFDERGQLSVLYPQFGARVASLQPRTFGVSVRTSF